MDGLVLFQGLTYKFQVAVSHQRIANFVECVSYAYDSNKKASREINPNWLFYSIFPFDYELALD